jgi:hypothetical protein
MDLITQSVAEVVTLSVPEVSSIASRAARGTSYPWGLCEECGVAAAWFAEHGCDWAEPLLRRLSGLRGAKVQPAPKSWASDGPICALAAGTTLADFATLPEGPAVGGVVLGRVLDPVLLMPFLASVAVKNGRSYDCFLGEDLWLCVSGTGQVFESASLSAEVADVALRPTSTTSRMGRPLEPCTVKPIPKTLYAQFEELALRMTVADTAASAKRAGASGSDND